ncbi:hypothetical protein ES707_16599 [subsurface metagenome]
MYDLYECPYCGKVFYSPGALVEHINYYHPPAPPPPVYTCPQCGAKFDSQAKLDSHIAAVHPPAPPPVYTCPICGAQFATQTALDSHKVTAHPPVPPPEPEEPEPPPYVALPWIGSIWSFVWDIAGWFQSAYQEVSGWIWPFYYLQYPLYGLYRVFKSMLTPIADFWLWAEDMATKIVGIWTSGGILGLIQWWFPWLYNVGEWFYNRWQWFLSAVGDWWESTKTTVLGWIDIAVQGFNALLVWWDEFWKITWPRWMATLEVLGNEVSNFFTKTLPGLLDYLKLEYWWNGKLWDVDGLIGSKLAEWFPFYDDIVEFINDPGEFLLTKLTDWFLGKEE